MSGSQKEDWNEQESNPRHLGRKANHVYHSNGRASNWRPSVSESDMTTAKLKCQPGLTSPWTPATTSACWTSDSWSWFQNLSLGSYGHFQNFSVPSCSVVMSPLGQFIKYFLPCKAFLKSGTISKQLTCAFNTQYLMNVIKTFVIKASST